MECCYVILKENKFITRFFFIIYNLCNNCEKAKKIRKEWFEIKGHDHLEFEKGRKIQCYVTIVCLKWKIANI